MSLASKLPYNHPFAGGYPGLGSQPLPSDSDALAYLGAVAAADGAGVEVSVALAVDGFFKDLKSAGIFDAIKASCILCGARTLSGALVPLAGSAPTNNNFVAADYNRETGLVGNGSTKYLDSNRLATADGNADIHQSVYVSSAHASGIGAYIGQGGGLSGSTHLLSNRNNADFVFRNRESTAQTVAGAAAATGFVGASRASASAYDGRVSGSTTSFTVAADASNAEDHFVFARVDSGSAISHTTARLAFYSIGAALDLEDLDDAVSALVTAIGAAV
jgi:hypothetical protein